MAMIVNQYSKIYPTTSSDRQITSLFLEIWVAESTSDVRILSGR